MPRGRLTAAAVLPAQVALGWVAAAAAVSARGSGAAAVAAAAVAWRYGWQIHSRPIAAAVEGAARRPARKAECFRGSPNDLGPASAGHSLLEEPPAAAAAPPAAARRSAVAAAAARAVAWRYGWQIQRSCLLRQFAGGAIGGCSTRRSPFASPPQRAYPAGVTCSRATRHSESSSEAASTRGPIGRWVPASRPSP